MAGRQTEQIKFYGGNCSAERAKNRLIQHAGGLVYGSFSCIRTSKHDDGAASGFTAALNPARPGTVCRRWAPLLRWGAGVPGKQHVSGRVFVTAARRNHVLLIMPGAHMAGTAAVPVILRGEKKRRAHKSHIT